MAEPPIVAKMKRLHQHYLDKTIPWMKCRWAAYAAMIVLYAVRVFLKKGFYIITYGLGIYTLNLFIGFLSPAVDPEADSLVLPTSDKEEFRPFTRKLPEFKFWVAAFRAVFTAQLVIFVKAFDLPVYWPILFVYFLLLVVITMKERIKHMAKHGYLPWTFGKQTYGELTKVKAPAQNGKSGKADK
eukprot:CAMPEP_0178388448 /NCGR_PEP_ID=MMETSP0689_2-20121128/9598_1 /TAXON_ID=160604 /ORGANISM="Amphidinium massartii, Strain CS-259" /LENGTH=184 /DNA_ID=CAMNT_0020008851 /DNA_START=14 /DNA_END=568 /DNA_ORIENTATION=-